MENVLILQARTMTRPADLEELRKSLVQQAQEGIILLPAQLEVLQLPGGPLIEDVQIRRSNLDDIMGKAEIFG